MEKSLFICFISFPRHADISPLKMGFQITSADYFCYCWHSFFSGLENKNKNSEPVSKIKDKNVFQNLKKKNFRNWFFFRRRHVERKSAVAWIIKFAMVFLRRRTDQKRYLWSASIVIYFPLYDGVNFIIQAPGIGFGQFFVFS